jgi:predicted nucleic acid-binding protein
MPANVVADAGFLVALLDRRDTHHDWAVAQAARYVPPWVTCEAVLTETFYLLGSGGEPLLIALLRRARVRVSFELIRHQESVLGLMQKYAGVPMSLADACLVRMTELLADPILLTTDTDFRIYRRHSRQVVPCVLPR